jgi:hypothetical protein
MYIMDQVDALHKSNKWRKLLKWSSYLDPLLELVNKDGKRILLTMFKDANQMGSNTTNDASYSSTLIPILQKLIVLFEKDKNFGATGKLLCEMGQSFSFIDDEKEEMACYRRAIEIGDKHGIAGVKCVGNLGVGRIFAKNQRLLEAKPLLRIALESAESECTDWMNEHAVMICDEFCAVLFSLNSIDEAEPIVKRFPKLLKKLLGPSSPRLQHYHMRGHILLARFHEAKNRPEEAVSEIYKMLALIDANKDAIHDFRPLFIHLLDQALESLRILQNTDIGDLHLAKAVCDLRIQQMMKDSRWSSV